MYFILYFSLYSTQRGCVTWKNWKTSSTHFWNRNGFAGEAANSSHWKGGMVGFTAHIDVSAKRLNSCPAGNWITIPRTSSSRPNHYDGYVTWVWGFPYIPILDQTLKLSNNTLLIKNIRDQDYLYDIHNSTAVLHIVLTAVTTVLIGKCVVLMS